MLVAQMPDIDDADVEKVIGLIRDLRGIDLSGYRKSFFSRRLAVRLDYYRLRSVDKYIDLLQKDPQEWARFLENLCINVSEFFRDPEVFEAFKEKCLADIFRRAAGRKDRTAMIWSCGCSCGEESYSLAILLEEFAAKQGIDDVLWKVYASDIDKDALLKARQGVYRKDALTNIAPDILEKYFTFHAGSGKEDDPDIWRSKEQVEANISFERHDRHDRWSHIWHMDAVLCVMSEYILIPSGSGILADIFDRLNDGGYLVLGKIESVVSSRGICLIR